MKCRTLSIVAVLILLTVAASSAQAMYHTGMGRFMQRDPNGTALVSAGRMGAASRVGSAGPAAGGGFIQRDPIRQYADGMNLYQYVRSGPTRYVDQLGLSTFQIDQNFGWPFHYPMGDAMETAENSGFFRDEVDMNCGAEESEILNHLAEMDGSDMWVYIGHANDNVLSEHDYLTPNEPISSDAIRDALQNKGTRTAPGIVVIAGCKSCKLAQVFLDAGSKCVICFDKAIGGPSAAEFVSNFIEQMFATGSNHRGFQWSIRQAFENAKNKQASWMYAGGEDAPVKLKCRKDAYYDMHFGRISAMPVDESRYK